MAGKSADADLGGLAHHPLALHDATAELATAVQTEGSVKVPGLLLSYSASKGGPGRANLLRNYSYASVRSNEVGASVLLGCSGVGASCDAFLASEIASSIQSRILG